MVFYCRWQLGNDPTFCSKLIPKYEFGCKRITFSLGEYLPLFVDKARRKNRPVVLVTDPIVEMTERGIKTDKEELDFDLIGKGPSTRTFSHPILSPICMQIGCPSVYLSDFPTDPNQLLSTKLLTKKIG
jgi:hypothetical protein